MENRRAETLEALSAYIESQKMLLAHTQNDIARLRKLRNDAVGRPKNFMGNITSELNSNQFKLSEQADCGRALPEKIDWELFAVHDPTPLQTLTLTTRETYSRRNRPHTTQQSPLSSLQQFVKDARKTLVDPTLSPINGDPSFSNLIISPSLASHSLPSDDEEAPVPKVHESLTAARRRERERAKIRQLKMRTFGCGLTVSTGPSGDGVFVRRDVGDESGEVDIWADEDDLRDVIKNAEPPQGAVEINEPTKMDERIVSLVHTTNPRRVKPPLKVQTQELVASSPVDTALSTTSSHKPRGLRRRSTAKVEPEPSPATSPLKQALGKRSRETDEKADGNEKDERDNGKPRPETYKMAWSVSEQHLLERLLEEIPVGERNRWQKISTAMNGRRTPRQVASRVQKYFEKLKRFGIGVDGARDGKAQTSSSFNE